MAVPGYLFRMELDCAINVTLTGSPARFISHCCNGSLIFIYLFNEALSRDPGEPGAWSACFVIRSLQVQLSTFSLTIVH